VLRILSGLVNPDRRPGTSLQDVSVAPGAETSRLSEPRARWTPSPADGVFVVGLAILIGYAAWLGRDLWFISDDWNFIALHHNGNYLAPYNDHLWLFPVAIFHALYVTVGLGSYAPYLVVGLVAYAALGISLFVYARQRVWPGYAALAALSILWFSTAQFNVLFPLLINFSVPLAATVAIWMLLDRDTALCDLAAGGFLAVALASNSVALITLAAVGTELLLRRAPLRRWLPFAPPFALWLLWYISYRTPVAGPGGVAETLRYALHEIQATFAGFAGGWDPGGYVLFGATVGVFTLSIVRWRTFNARAASALTAVALFALLTSFTRAGFVPPVPATTPRFLWVNGFFLVVALIEVVRGRRLSPSVALVCAVIVAVGAVMLVGNLRTYHRQALESKRSVRTFLVATEAIPNRIDRRRVLPVSYIPVRVGDFLPAVRHLGSPVRNVGLRDLGTHRDRTTADGWMIHDLGLRFAPIGAEPEEECTAVQPDAAERGFEVHGPETVIVRAGATPATWSFRRLAVRFGPPTGEIQSGELSALRIPRDHSSLAWHVRVQGVGASVRTCPGFGGAPLGHIARSHLSDVG
jgi:hypothetical protein